LKKEWTVDSAKEYLAKVGIDISENLNLIHCIDWKGITASSAVDFLTHNGYTRTSVSSISKGKRRHKSLVEEVFGNDRPEIEDVARLTGKKELLKV
jgi:hypothetical protein